MGRRHGVRGPDLLPDQEPVLPASSLSPSDKSCPAGSPSSQDSLSGPSPKATPMAIGVTLSCSLAFSLKGAVSPVTC